MRYQKPRGTQDFLPDYLDKWDYVESVWRKIVTRYNFREIVTPMFEMTELFYRTAGDTSDIVTKEMYTFNDRGGRSITLRPEGTASVVRAYFENKLYVELQPVKLFYLMPMFRYERPQAGRFRQHYQYGVECIGVRSPFIDAEIMSLFMDFYRELGVIEPVIWLNSLGCDDCRPKYKQSLVDYLQDNRCYLCEECKNRLENNPLRVLDCKNETCRKYIDNAPLMKDNLCQSCDTDFSEVQRLLMLRSINYTLSPMLVRGLDYYNRTVFEIAAKGVSSKEVIAGGGRYDLLLNEIGGIDSSAFGAGAGMERLIQTLEMQGVVIPTVNRRLVSIISLCEEANEKSFILTEFLRDRGFSVELILNAKKIGKLLSVLSDNSYIYAIMIGTDELASKVITLKNLETRKQQTIPLSAFEQISEAMRQ